MDSTEKDKILEYAIKMLERGDLYSDILRYLNKKEVSEEYKKEIITALEEHKRKLNKEEKKYRPVSISKLAFGLMFLVLTLYLEYLGIIYFPWTIMGYIVGALALLEIVKAFLNLRK